MLKMGRKTGWGMNLKGQKFSSLTVIEQIGRNCTCKCDCGNIANFQAHRIKMGTYKSCGCKHYKFKDLTNQTFGRLTVIEKVSQKPVKWLCRCECGKELVKSAAILLMGHAKSCGCLQQEIRDIHIENNTLPYGEAAYRSVFNSYKCGATKRALAFEITLDEFKEITNKPCYYCGTKQSRRYKHKHQHGECSANGIDRIDNNLGYVKGNMRPCCTWCNKAKSNLSANEFIEKIKDIVKHLLQPS